MRALRKRYGRATSSGEPWGGESAQGAHYRAFRVVTDRVGDEHNVVWQGSSRAKADKEFESAVRAAKKSSARHGRTLVQIHGQESASTWRVLHNFDTLVHGGR